MGKVKDYVTTRLEDIALATGYEFSFLMKEYLIAAEDGTSMESTLDYIERVSVEHDW